MHYLNSQIKKWFESQQEKLNKDHLICDDLDYFIELKKDKVLQLKDALVLYEAMQLFFGSMKNISVKMIIRLNVQDNLDLKFGSNIEEIGNDIGFSPPLFILEKSLNSEQEIPNNNLKEGEFFKVESSAKILELDPLKFNLVYFTYLEKYSNETEWNRSIEISNKT